MYVLCLFLCSVCLLSFVSFISVAVIYLYMYGRTRCCIATFLNLACAVAVVDSKVTEVRGNFVEDECYQMATEFQETSLRPDISVACA